MNSVLKELYRFDHQDINTAASLFNMSYWKCRRLSSECKKLGYLTAYDLKVGGGRPVKLYFVNRERYKPMEVSATNLKEFLTSFLKMERELGLRYALGSPFSTSVHGRPQVFSPWFVYVPVDALRLVREIFVEYVKSDLLKVKPVVDDEPLKRSGHFAQLGFLSSEDTVVHCLLHAFDAGFESMDKWYSPFTMSATTVVLHKFLATKEHLDIAYLSRRAVVHKVCSRLLELEDFVKKNWNVYFLDKKHREDLVWHSKEEEPTKQLLFDRVELDEYLSTPPKYYEMEPWRSLFGWFDFE